VTCQNVRVTLATICVKNAWSIALLSHTQAKLDVTVMPFRCFQINYLVTVLPFDTTEYFQTNHK
jgi:hypothetical protein